MMRGLVFGNQVVVSLSRSWTFGASRPRWARSGRKGLEVAGTSDLPGALFPEECRKLPLPLPLLCVLAAAGGQDVHMTLGSSKTTSGVGLNFIVLVGDSKGRPESLGVGLQIVLQGASLYHA